MARTTATTRLAKLRDTEATERHAQRDLDAQAEAATTSANEARQALVEAHANGNAAEIRRAERAHREAQARAEDAAIKAEAQALRVKRAASEVQTFKDRHASDLIAEELAAAGKPACEQMVRGGRDIEEGNRKWHESRARIDDFLAHIPGASGAHDAPSDHELGPIAREVRNFFRSGGEVRSPGPHYAGLSAQQTSQEVEAA